MKYWLGVVSKEHVLRGVKLGIAQIGHGKKSGLARMKAGDGFAYYSPKESFNGDEPLQAFTAIGKMKDDEIWQADEGDFKPWRRRVLYNKNIHDASVHDIRSRLELTSQPNWGYQLRRGLVELSKQDFNIIQTAMMKNVH